MALKEDTGQIAFGRMSHAARILRPSPDVVKGEIIALSYLCRAASTSGSCRQRVPCA
jgi:hypothetical protein